MRDVCDKDLKVVAVLYLDGVLYYKRIVTAILQYGKRIEFSNGKFNSVEEVLKRYKIND